MSEELREAIARALFDASQDPEDFYQVAWEDNYARDEWYASAAALLSGPLASLLAAQAAVERVDALAETFNAPVPNGSFPGQTALFGGGDVCYRIRRALRGTP